MSIPEHILKKAKAASFERWGCVEARSMYCNYDFDFREWFVSPLFFGPDSEDGSRSFAVVVRGRALLLI